MNLVGRKDHSGKRFGKLFVLRIHSVTKTGNTTFVCKCDCGNEKVVAGGKLGRRNYSISCGCGRGHNQFNCDPSRTHKICPRCKADKELEQFGLSTEKVDGHSGYCKKCMVSMHKMYRNRYKKRRADKTRSRRRSDIHLRLLDNIRRRINSFIFKEANSPRTMELLGCSLEEIKRHLEIHFSDGMSWDNYGRYGWHIDHIIPCASFDFADPEQQKKCFHWTNLQPLWADENIRKQDKLPEEWAAK